MWMKKKWICQTKITMLKSINMLFMAPIITEIPIVLTYKLKMTILKDLLVEAFQGHGQGIQF